MRRDRPIGEQPAPRLCALVLAAGRSERFGSPKPLLRWGDTSLIAHQVRSLACLEAVTEVVVVTGHGASDVRAELEGLPVRVVLNPDYAAGRATSVACGVRAIGADCAGILLVNVDQPLHARALAELVDAWTVAPDDIVRPLHDGRRGHPVIFPGDLRAELEAVDDVTEGARAIVLRHTARVRDVPTAYQEVLLNLNTREAYEAALAAHEIPATDERADSGS